MCKQCNIDQQTAPVTRDTAIVRRKRKLVNYLQPIKK